MKWVKANTPGPCGKKKTATGILTTGQQSVADIPPLIPDAGNVELFRAEMTRDKLGDPPQRGHDYGVTSGLQLMEITPSLPPRKEPAGTKEAGHRF